MNILKRTTINFPTELHQQTTETVAAFFAASPLVDTLLIVNSIARGQATPDSDLDLAVLVEPSVPAAAIQRLEQDWVSYSTSQPTLVNFRQSGRFAHIHLDVVQGVYFDETWDDGGGPDAFEIEIGNQLAYSVPHSPPGPYFQQLHAKWLPFYAELLRSKRLEMVRNAALYDLDHVAFFVQRGLYFAAFDRLYRAFQEFLQALFIARRTYPIAYNKWIREQVENWLKLPDLYAQLPTILSISQLESPELVQKSIKLRALLEHWTQEE